MRRINIIVARDRAGVIGKAGDLPWRLRGDLLHFKKTTLGHTLVMGRRTWESIGRPLPGRRTIVMSRAPSLELPGEVFHARSLEEAVESADPQQELFVCGGEAVYAAALPAAQRLYLTEVDTLVEGGDARFPEIDEAQWREVERTEHPADARNEHGFVIRRLERVG